MISIALLVAWMASGALVALTARPSGDSRFAWVPMAVIFGPLWSAVSSELSDEHHRQHEPAVARVEARSHASTPRTVAVS